MGVAYSSPDSPYTRLCAVYTCPCGAAASEVGTHAGELPPGWERPAGETWPPGWERLAGETCICAHCAERLHAGEALPGPGSSA